MQRRQSQPISRLIRAFARSESDRPVKPEEPSSGFGRLPEIPPSPELRPLSVSRFKREPELIFAVKRRRRDQSLPFDSADGTDTTPGAPPGCPDAGNPPPLGSPPWLRATMEEMPWLQTLSVLVVASALLPPIGLVLLWLRATRIGWKLAGTVAIALISVAHLYYFWGLRWERDGGGIRPIFSFGDQESRARALEESRAAMHPAPEVKPAPTDFWTDFRGPGRLGHYSEKPILTNWPGTGLHRLWKQPIGGGYASFVIAGGLAYTIEQRRDDEYVAAYDVATGKERWTNSWRAHFSESMGGDGPRTTPVYDSGRLYALGAEGEFRCLDARTGKVIWRKNILEENGASNLMWAQSSSPTRWWSCRAGPMESRWLPTTR